MHIINHAQYTPRRKPFKPAVKSTPKIQWLGALKDI